MTITFSASAPRAAFQLPDLLAEDLAQQNCARARTGKQVVIANKVRSALPAWLRGRSRGANQTFLLCAHLLPCIA